MYIGGAEPPLLLTRPELKAMDPNRSHPHGLRLTLRHAMILVANFAVLLAVIAPIYGSRATGWDIALMTGILPWSLLLLAVLVFILDRPGPMKYWLVDLLCSLFLPAFLLWFDAMSAAAWWMSGDLPVGRPLMLVLNAGGIYSLRDAIRNLPGRCPDCGRRSLLPLSRHCWCASCGVDSPR